MSKLFEDCDFVMVYIDDVVIFSRSFAEHIEHVQIVLQKLNGANLKANPQKCDFGRTKILILGYMISEQGIQVCSEKLLQMESWKAPTTGKQVMQHLGFLNYFREMIPSYSTLMAPIEKLRFEKVLKWTPEYQVIYDKAFKILSSELVLSYPDFSKEFMIATDASNHGIGAVLYQEIDGKTRFISFISRALSGGESNYSATKRELLGIVFALKKFRYYVFGTHFKLFTDHMALTYLHTQKHFFLHLY